MANKKMNVLRTSKLLQVYEELAKKTFEMLDKYEDEQLIASSLVAQGIKLYKGILTEQEFKDMLKIIVNDATTIRPMVEEEKKKDTLN